MITRLLKNQTTQQLNFTDVGFSWNNERLREKFINKMNQINTWVDLISITAPFCSLGSCSSLGRWLEIMLLRVHMLQNWLSLADCAFENAVCNGFPFTHSLIGAPYSIKEGPTRVLLRKSIK